MSNSVHYAELEEAKRGKGVWVLASIIGALVAIGLSRAVFLIPNEVDPRGEIFTEFWIVVMAGALIGAVVGIAQLLVLRSCVEQTGRWLLVSMIGGCLGAPLFVISLVITTIVAFYLVAVVDMAVSAILGHATGMFVCQVIALPIAMMLAAPVFGSVIGYAQSRVIARQARRVGSMWSWGWVLINVIAWAVVALLVTITLDKPATNFGCGILD